jgi:hypothetical protein
MHSPRSMQLKLSPSYDVDRFRHFEARQNAWAIERRHMQIQLERERQQKLAKGKTRQASVAAKSKQLAASWRSEDVVKVHDEARVQSSRGRTEAETRQMESMCRNFNESLHHDKEVSDQLGHRKAIEERARAHDRRYEHRGTHHWANVMETGAARFATERADFEKAQAAALKGFAWAKVDEAAEDELAREVKGPQSRLPTGPGAAQHHQTPGVWRAAQLSMAPARWHTSPLNSEVVRASSAQSHGHARERKQRAAEREHADAMLHKQALCLEQVAERSYASWRHKVDATRSAQTPSWPDQRTHRIRATTLSPRESPRRMER